MVVREEFFAIKLEEVIHLLPQAAALARMNRLERDVRRGPMTGHSIVIVQATIALVARHFAKLEILRSRIDEIGKELGVTCIFIANFDCRHNVCLHATHKVDFDPSMLLPDRSVFVVEPADKTRRREAGRVRCEIAFDGFERQAAFDNHSAQGFRNVWVVKRVEDRVEMRRLGDQSLFMCRAEVGHEPATGNRAVDLEAGREDCVANRQSWTARSLFARVHQTVAQIAQQLQEHIFFLRLGCVVRAPLLRIGLLWCGNRRSWRNRRPFPGPIEFDGPDVLAPSPIRFMVRTGAVWLGLVRAHRVLPTGPGTGGDEPNTTLLGDAGDGGEFRSLLFPRVHGDAVPYVPFGNIPTRYIRVNTHRYIT